MQRRDAINFERALVVLSSDRWTEVLVRRQADAFESFAGMAEGGIFAGLFQRKSYSSSQEKARRSVRRARPGVERR